MTHVQRITRDDLARAAHPIGTASLTCPNPDCRKPLIVVTQNGRVMVWHRGIDTVSCFPIEAADGGWIEPEDATEEEGVADAIEHAPPRVIHGIQHRPMRAPHAPLADQPRPAPTACPTDD